MTRCQAKVIITLFNGNSQPLVFLESIGHTAFKKADLSGVESAR